METETEETQKKSQTQRDGQAETEPDGQTQRDGQTQPDGQAETQPDGHTETGGGYRTGFEPPYGFNGASRPLHRLRDEGMITGTAAGIAAYLRMDPTIVRVAFVALALLGGAGVPLYLAAWLLIPEAGADQSIATDFFEHARETFGAPHAA